MKIGELSGMLGITPQSIRAWENRGIVAPERDILGYRNYSKGDVINILNYLKNTEEVLMLLTIKTCDDDTVEQKRFLNLGALYFYMEQRGYTSVTLIFREHLAILGLE